ncbi:MAG: radical SAM protein [Candidatus Dadabacteria bacterium]|nr:radical SAM protein [Candidatus Dadabacteria bacterium]
MAHPSVRSDRNFIYKKPINVYFESTIACDLACKHCRAEAIPERSPDELDTEEAKALVRDVKGLGSHLIISGGDPLKREDLFEILAYARELKVPVGVTPTTSPLATYEAVEKMKDLGVFALGISLDGATPASQDSFRGVEGTFENSMNVLSYAKELEIPVQINTTCTEETVSEIEGIYHLLTEEFSPPVRRWSIFFLIPIGRGNELGMPSSAQVEETFGFLYEKSSAAPFHITTTEAPFYRAYYIVREMESGKTKEEVVSSRAMGLGVRDGNGVMFVSHTGDIYPSGFLPILLGNVRRDSLADVYRNNAVMKALRDPGAFKGKCAPCPFNYLCGGSRARAFAVEGDYLQADPLCHFSEEFLQGVEF